MDSIIRRNFLNPKNLIAGSGFAAFHSPEYRLFWVAAAFSNIGMWALVYGRLWLMHSLTDSPLMVGLVNTATLGPVLLFSIWGGAIADRVNRLKLVQATRGMFAFLALLTGILIATGVVQAWHVIVISVATGILLAFDIPSRGAMLPALLPKEHLASGVALYSIVFGGASIVGPAFFAPLVGLWGIEGVFFLIGGSYVLTVLVLMFMQSSLHQQQARSASLARGVVEGFKYVSRSRPLMGTILLGVCIGLFGTSYEALLPAFSDDVLLGGINTYSRLLLFEGIGGLTATLAIAVLGTQIDPVRFMFVGGIGFGLGMLVLGGISWLWVAVVVMALLGGFRVVFGTLSTTLMQTLSADEFRGRVMSLHQFTWGATALGSLMMGAFAEGIGIPVTIALGGGVVVVSALSVAMWMFRSRPELVLDTAASDQSSPPTSPLR
ncbi:MAG: MFS transporter [Chloroflexi bacterium]|nr:MFS transporter [Chloroflexota bacterium]